MFSNLAGVPEAITNILYDIISIVYTGITNVYSLFLTIASARLFEDDFIASFTQRIYIILGIVALFIFAYTMLQGIVNPEEGQKNGKEIIKRFVISLVVVALIPTIFSVLYQVQYAVLSDNVIGNLFFDSDEAENITLYDPTGEEEYLYYNDNGTNYTLCAGCLGTKFTQEELLDKCKVGVLSEEVSGSGICTNGAHLLDEETKLVEQQRVIGSQFSYMILKGFLYPFAEDGSDGGENTFTFDPSWWPGSTEISSTYENVERIIILTGDFSYLSLYAEAVHAGEMQFDWLFALIAGLVAFWIILSFTIDVAVRAFKLAFLQLIAPIPIFMSIYPKNANLLGDFIKKLLATYFEVFVRVFCVLGIMFFAVNLDEVFFDSLGEGALGFFARAFVFIGLLIFAKQLPKLIGDITGIKGDGIKLGLKDKLKDSGATSIFKKGATLAGRGAAIGAAGLKQGVNKFNNTEGNGFKKVRGFISGSASASARTAWATRKANNLGDIKSGYASGLSSAASAQEKKVQQMARYKSDNHNFVQGKFGDIKTSMESWSGKYNADALKKEKAKVDKVSEVISSMEGIIDGSDRVVAANSAKSNYLEVGMQAEKKRFDKENEELKKSRIEAARKEAYEKSVASVIDNVRKQNPNMKENEWKELENAELNRIENEAEAIAKAAFDKELINKKVNFDANQRSKIKMLEESVNIAKQIAMDEALVYKDGKYSHKLGALATELETHIKNNKDNEFVGKLGSVTELINMSSEQKTERARAVAEIDTFDVFNVDDSHVAKGESIAKYIGDLKQTSAAKVPKLDENGKPTGDFVDGLIDLKRETKTTSGNIQAEIMKRVQKEEKK